MWNMCFINFRKELSFLLEQKSDLFNQIGEGNTRNYTSALTLLASLIDSPAHIRISKMGQ
jgi:hypothetical protein